MCHTTESSQRSSAHTLSRRVRRDELRVGHFKRLQFAQQRVVLRITDNRRIVHVVRLIVSFDLTTQPVQACDDRVQRIHS